MTTINYTVVYENLPRDISSYSPGQRGSQDLLYWLFSWPILLEVGGVFPLQEGSGGPPRIPVVRAAYLLDHAARSLSHGEEATFSTGGVIRGAIIMTPDSLGETVVVRNDYTGAEARVSRQELVSAIGDFGDRVRTEMRAVLPDLAHDEVLGEWFRQDGAWATG